MVTIKDVARESGVAISTVSNVLNNVSNVKKETRKKVLEAAEKLKYVPNMNAKYLKTGKKNTIGLFLASVQGDYYRKLIQAVHLQCRLAKYLLNIYVSNDNTAEEVYGMIISSGVQGAIIVNDCLTEEYIDRIALARIPIVFADCEYSRELISSVSIDNYSGATLAMEYLVKQGHRRIGYLHGVPRCHDDEERYRAYLAVMNKYNLAIDDNVILNGYFEEMIAYSEISMLVHRNVELPDAFFCANDEMAWGCIKALQALGIQVPEQVSVVGYDDNTMSAHCNPSLTTIAIPVTELGSNCAIELLRLVRGEGNPTGTSSKLAGRLIARDSCMLKI